MGVSITQDISAGTANPCRGQIMARVTGTNRGNSDLVGSAGALGFYLTDYMSGQYVPGFLRTDPHIDDAQSLPPGGSFEREIHFATGPVEFGRKYLLRCIFDQTNDVCDETFEFRPYYLGGVGGAAPFAAQPVTV